MESLNRIPESERSDLRPQVGGVTSSRRLHRAIRKARRATLDLQQRDGHWCAELEGDSILESEYIIAMYFMGLGKDDRLRKAANTLRDLQLPGGGWAIFPGGDAEVSASVKGYFALKLLGDDPQAEHMRRARRVALELGGIRSCNSYTKLYLAMFGQYPWKRCPVVPPEMILLPAWFPFNIYKMSAWSRAIVVPLSMIWASKPVCAISPEQSIPELDRNGTIRHRAKASTLREEIWATFFEAVDVGVKVVETLRLRPFRKRALRRCEEWIVPRLEKSDGLGAIIPPILNTLLALRCQGYENDHPIVVSQLRELEKLEIQEDDSLRMQPCKSPVWDTAQALNALLEAGSVRDEPSVHAAARWLLDHEVSEAGDWKINNESIPVGGWYFEYANEFYPDCDDTAEVITALSKVRFPDAGSQERLEGAIERGREWLLGMQNDDGGWASFDRECDREALTFIPFADHNAMIDPSTVDITSRVLEALRASGLEPSHPQIRRGIEFLLDEQEDDGCWYGRWGANYLYGTWLAIVGLNSVDFDMGHESCRRAVSWLIDHQNDDGGWGESLRSYEDHSWAGRGTSTVSQTSWVMHALILAGEIGHPAVQRGLEFLLERQDFSGSWEEELWTGTGFPTVFYLKYHYYASYFPLLTLGIYAQALEGRGEKESVA